MLINAKLLAFGVAATAVLGTIYLGYRHYNGLLDEISTLQVSEARLEQALETQKETTTILRGTIDQWEQAAAEYDRQIEDLRRSRQQALSETRRLNDIFDRHDLTTLALAKPGLVQRRVNDGTERMLGLLECETGRSGRCSGGSENAGDDQGTPEARSARSEGD